MKKLFNRNQAAQSGFTIVELMIATLIFSVILVVITVGVVTFTNDYYKGINSSTTQNAARSIIDTVAQAVQFNDTAVNPVPLPPGGTTYCIGGEQFDFLIGKELGVDTTKSIWESPAASTGGGCTSIPNPNANSKELLAPKMRLVTFSINSLTTNLYTIDVRVAYGDNDLLCAPISHPGSCTSTTSALLDNQLTTSDVTCKPRVGSQFCAVSDLTTTAQIRGITSAP